MNSKQDDEQTRLSLLHNTQAYLKSLLEAQAPDAILVQAWEEFYSIYDDLMRRFVISQGLPHSDVDDCLQEVWSGVVKGLTGFKRQPNRPGLRAWLYTLVRRRAVDLFRHKARRTATSLEQAAASGHEPSDPAADPATLCEQHWEAALLQSMLVRMREKLSNVNYRILHMRLIEDRDVKDVAAELNLTPDKIRTRHSRAMRKLRTYMAAFTGDAE